MDHLQEALKHVVWAKDADSPVYTNKHSGLAIACALIALVERLDALMTDSGDEDQRRAIRVFREVEL